MHQRLAEVMNFVEQKRRELLKSFAGVEGELLSRRDGPVGWSVAEILDHLRMVESGVTRVIAKRVGQAKQAGLGDEKSTSSVMSSFDQHAAYLEGAVLKSPAMVQPRGDIDVDDAITGSRNRVTPYAPLWPQPTGSRSARSSTITSCSASSISING